MRYLLPFIFALTLIGCQRIDQPDKQAIDYVNPFIGTGGHGHTYPGATTPFGMVQLSADTRLDGWDGCSGYHYSDDVIYGFSHTHLSGTGVSDYGDVLLMPCTGDIQFNNGAERGPDHGYASRFRKNTERASVGYYAVHLDNYGIDVELTASPRAGVHRYRQLKDDFHLIIDLEHRDQLLSHSLQHTGTNEICGHRISRAWAQEQHVYFVAQFSRPISAFIPSKTPVMRSGNVHMGGDNYAKIPTKAAVEFEGEGELVVKVGLSAVSIDHARANLLAEVEGFDFDRVHEAARAAWELQLAKIEVHGKEEKAKEIFYTALYHTMLAPNVWSDVDGSYRGMDMAVHQAEHAVYTVFSLWDTFRALHPLFTLIERERSEDFLRTFLLHYSQGGRLPVWELAANETDCMIGYHSIPVVVDAYAKGIAGFDTELMLEAMRAVSEMDHFGLESYRTYGYVRAADEPESVSKTLEYAYDDWCIAQFALALGDTATYQVYSGRAQYYRNLFDPHTGFFRARLDGGWAGPFDPAEVNHHYTEANAWQYSLFAPHDTEGLMDLLGGPAGLESHLDQLFSASSQTTGRAQADITGLIGQYAHGNEPSHHMAYLYNHAGAPWKSQARVRQILDEQYTTAPDGLSGNEDCGQMSAWYVLSAMGFYPVTPGLPEYAIGSPLFDSVAIHLENGRTFRIISEENGKGSPYIQEATLNGEPWSKGYLPHEAIMAGGELRFLMGSKPNKSWGTGVGNTPSSRAGGVRMVAVPFFESGSPTFGDSMTVSIGTADPDVQIYYRINGSEPQVYDRPFELWESARVEAWAECPEGRSSTTTMANWYKVDQERTITLGMTYANPYSAGGGSALIDHLRGTGNYQTGRWQGYQGQDFEATVDFGRIRQADSVGVGFLQDVKSWIWLPPKVRFEASTDGEGWTALGTAGHEVPDDLYGSHVRDFAVAPKAPFRYLKVTAPNYGPCPEWHMGAGGESWLFADEIWAK